MKFVHLSDLHLGKRLNEFSLLEDQEYIIEGILKIIDNEKPDGVIIAGDIYDKSIPPVSAVELFDSFMVRLAQRKLQIYVISGNHDSAERVSCGGRLMENSGVHIAPVYNGCVKPIELEDEYGKVNIYLLPFIKPMNVRPYHEDVETYTDAMRAVVNDMNIDTNARNILVTHQFVTGAQTCDSEEIMVGGTDNVDGTAFADFDYVALGHIHRPQNVASEKIRYCGTPLKYSFSEANNKKSVSVVEIREKGSLQVREVPLKPKRDMVILEGNYNTLMDKNFYSGTTYKEDYVHIILTDETERTNVLSELRTVYHNIMQLSYNNTRTSQERTIEIDENVNKKSPNELFANLFETQNNHSMIQEQRDFVAKLVEEIWEEY